MVKAEPRLEQPKFLLIQHYRLLAQANLSAGRGDKAVDAAKRLADALPEERMAYYAAALEVARAASKQNGSDMTDESTLAKRIELASRMIRRAVDLGYDEADELRSNSDFDPLRSHPDFVLAVLDASFPRNPFFEPPK